MSYVALDYDFDFYFDLDLCFLFDVFNGCSLVPLQ